MKAIFGIVSLLVVLGITSVLVKKQLTATGQVQNPQQQSQQAQQQVKQQVEAAMQQARPASEEK
jgi:cytoskeletal protein RodZ